MRKTIIGAVVLLVVVSAAQVLGQTPDVEQAWIDAPLEWVVIDHAPVGIVAHVADPDGVGMARLEVDGSVAEDVATGGGMLEVVEFSWSPDGSGVYELRVIAYDRVGRRGGESAITVVVELEDAPPTPTTVATTTTVPATTTTMAATTTTAQVTTTTCGPGVLVATGPTGMVLTETPTLTWSYSGCEPEYFEVQISNVSDFTTILTTEYIPGGGRQWAVPDPLETCDTFYWRVRTWEEAGVGAWSNVVMFEVYC
ncbi:MAG TPA: hypothetical protein VK960_04925 [Acidimicrobiia bacterium]|nr:hypothetical protein [Acidimicrobiia bacterium]